MIVLLTFLWKVNEKRKMAKKISKICFVENFQRKIVPSTNPLCLQRGHVNHRR